MKIIQKLILGFVGISLLIGAVGYISVNYSQKELQKTIGGCSVILAQETLDKIDMNIYNRIEVIRAYCKDALLRELVMQSNKEFESLENIHEYIDEKDAAWRVVPKETVTPFMQEIIDNELFDELKEKVKFYNNKYGHKIYGEIFVTNKYGANAAQTGKTSDYYQADEEWWQTAKEEGFYIRDVTYDESAYVYSTDIGMRINDKDGMFLGVMKVVLNVEDVFEMLERARASLEYKTVSLELMTKEGNLIYETEWGHEIFEYVEELALFKKGKHADYRIMKEPGEEEELLACAYSKGYKDYKGLGWCLILENETEELLAPVVYLRNAILIISSVVISFAILISLFISRSISVPMIKLKNATIDIGNGKLETKIKIESKDEIGQLAFSFNKMSEDLQKSNNELRESQEILQSILDNSTAVIYIKDSQGRYILINHQYEILFNISKEWIVDKTDYDIFPKEIADEFRKNDRKVLEAGHPLEFEEIASHEDGLHSYIASKFPLTNAKNVIYGVCGISTDITKRKHEEEQIMRAFKEKEVLLDEVHHRVKNNLQIISSLLDMSSMQTQNQEAIELFAESRNRVEAMSLIHSQLYESEHFDEIDMERHIHELSGNLLKAYLKNQTMTLGIKVANVYLTVTQAVPCALVLSELISNVLKHAYAGGQQGIISISMQESDDGTIILKVKDNGVGIPEEVDVEMTKSLGLKLVRNIVYKQLNGTMKVVRDNGTELTVEFNYSKENS